MPKRTDLKSIAIIGAGPIIIGQACEFDYSGAQACKALRDEGYRVILINSNPATIMTDPEMADATYIEPITPDTVAKILEIERPDALLPTMGGQTALNTSLKLAETGVLDRLGIELIGANRHAIAKAEDRLLFKEAMAKIGLDCPVSRAVKTMDAAWDAFQLVGLPAIIRPSFTLGGTGGGIAYNKEEFETIVRGGLAASPTTEVLIEESVLGWKEYEMEVVRDKNDNAIIICAIENIDPMGVHTGDSITVAPALTLTDKEYQIMRNASIAVLREIGVETGGSNVQFAVNPDTGRMIVIEMNPRVSRSSALASKATGFPIAKIAAKLAVGYTLDELQNDITKTTPAAFEPTIDYVVTKIPRFAFEKFPGADTTLTTQMKSVGEAMAIGRNFQESMQKALRSLEKGLTGFDDQPQYETQEALVGAMARPTPQRLLAVAEGLRRGMTVREVYNICKIDAWFLRQIEAIVQMEAKIKTVGLPSDAHGLRQLKMMGFSDARLAALTDGNAAAVRAARKALNITPLYRRIDTCAAEFPSQTSYMYSSYESPSFGISACESQPSINKKVVILGGGPNRIGQGIEFDYCCVHASFALREVGIETIMVNCNPETVSTDYDTSDKLYFEPLTAEDVINILEREADAGEILGVIVQYGGQTPLKLAHDIEQAGFKILGTPVDAIDLAEDRERFQQLVEKIGLKQPINGLARSAAEAETIAADVGFPLVLRPSYVLGGQGMEIVTDMTGLRRYITTAVKVSGDNPVLLDQFLTDAGEVDVDAICDGTDVYIAGIMEHVEEAGIHSGDSACALPPYSLSPALIAEIRRQTELLAKSLGVIGLMNVQYAVKDNEVYLLEVNPRASRTAPFVAKATGVPIAKIGARVMAGEKLASFNLTELNLPHTAVKEAVFPFNKFPGVDVLLTPEMKSTGEVMGIDASFALAYVKAQRAAGVELPTSGTAFISLRERDKTHGAALAQQLLALGFTLVGTDGTAKTLAAQGIAIQRINKVFQGQPHIVDAMINGAVQLVINTTEGAQAVADSFSLRRTALMNNIPHYTTLSGARAALAAIEALQQVGTAGLSVGTLQDYLTKIPQAMKQAA